jgi:hypothetical protein
MAGRVKMNVLFSKCIGVLFCAAGMLMEPSCLRDSYEVKIAGPTEISDQWIEFQAKPHLKPEKDQQMIVLEMESPFKYDFYREGKEPNKGQGILMPDGEVINPEIQVVDQNGKVFYLVYAGVFGQPMIFLIQIDGREIASTRLFASVPRDLSSAKPSTGLPNPTKT